MANQVENKKELTIQEYLFGKTVSIILYNNCYFYKPGDNFKREKTQITNYTHLPNTYSDCILVNNEIYVIEEKLDYTILIINDVKYRNLTLTNIFTIFYLVNGISSILLKNEIAEVEKIINDGINKKANGKNY